MTEQEQHERLGRTLIEYAEAERAFTELKKQVGAYRQALKQAMEFLAAMVGGEFVVTLAAIDECPEPATLRALVEDVQLTKKRMRELAEELRTMGAGRVFVGERELIDAPLHPGWVFSPGERSKL